MADLFKCLYYIHKITLFEFEKKKNKQINKTEIKQKRLTQRRKHNVYTTCCSRIHIYVAFYYLILVEWNEMAMHSVA